MFPMEDNMIYFLHIKSTENLDCKYFFKTIEEMNRYFKKNIPTKIIEKFIDKRFVTVDGNKIEEEFENERSVQGISLQTYLEKKIDIQCIDEQKFPNYANIFRAEFFYANKKEAN